MTKKNDNSRKTKLNHTLLIFMSGINIAWSPSRPRVPPPQVTINNVPICKFFKFVSLTTILMQGGQALLISETKEMKLLKNL